MTKETVPAPATYIPSARSTPPGGRRRFGEADRKRIIEEACQPGASVSGVARRHGIAPRLLFRWKQELAPAAGSGAVFLPVTVADARDQPSVDPSSQPAPAPVIIERPAPGIEVELLGGRRVRFDRDADPEMVRRLVAVLEGEAR